MGMTEISRKIKDPWACIAHRYINGIGLLFFLLLLWEVSFKGEHFISESFQTLPQESRLAREQKNVLPIRDSRVCLLWLYNKSLK